ncbi:hypothetical protein JW968_01855 [Candidatus Woesearchaeota archaeon]|nr:hypothetical protein [Candidatus Woesearchaeota archaeon]
MNIARITEEFVDDNHSIRESLKKDLINYSSLARRIMSKRRLGPENFEAIVAAARRYRKRIGHSDDDSYAKELLKDIDLDIRKQKDKASIILTGKEDDVYAFITHIFSIFWERGIIIPESHIKTGRAELTLEKETISKALAALNL